MNNRFGFLLFNQFEDLDFLGPWEMIALWSQKFSGPNKLILVSENGFEITSAKNLVIKTHTNFEKCPQLDYLLVPGGQGTRNEVNNHQLLTFVQKQYRSCKQILSVCTGIFLLHEAGILNGEKVTTHWASFDRLKQLKNITVTESRFTKNEKIWTSAGISAGIDMTLAFIAEVAGEKTAGDVQLHSEYYPTAKTYNNNKNYLPAYVKSS